MPKNTIFHVLRHPTADIRVELRIHHLEKDGDRLIPQVLLRDQRHPEQRAKQARDEMTFDLQWQTKPHGSYLEIMQEDEIKENFGMQ